VECEALGGCAGGGGGVRGGLRVEARRGLVGEFEGCHGGPGDGGEDVVSQVGVAARMRRLQQRRPVPAVPRRDRHSGFQQPMVGDLRRGQRAVRCGRRRVRRRQRHRVGARLPAAVAAVRSARRPGVRIGPFNHVPFPCYKIAAQLPWRRQLVQGMLGAHLIGFQRPADATNFLRACRRVAPNQGARGPRALSTKRRQQR